MLLNANDFRFTVAQTAGLLRHFEYNLAGFGADWMAARAKGEGVFPFKKLAESQTIVDFRRPFDRGGYDVSSKEAVSLFALLLGYILSFREHERAEKRRRREAREKERRHLAAIYQPEDVRFQTGLEALNAEIMEDSETEGELLILRPRA